MRWEKRKGGGGFWRCVEKRRAAQRAWYRAKYRNDEDFAQRERDRFLTRYDADPIFRIGKNLRSARQRRLDRLERLKDDDFVPSAGVVAALDQSIDIRGIERRMLGSDR